MRRHGVSSVPDASERGHDAVSVNGFSSAWTDFEIARIVLAFNCASPQGRYSRIGIRGATFIQVPAFRKTF